MAKHGGGYVILDLRDAEPNNGGTDPNGFVNLTEQQVNAIKMAADEHLPVMYIGRGPSSEGLLMDTVSAAFTYALHNANEYFVGAPINDPYAIGFFTATLNGTSLTFYTA